MKFHIFFNPYTGYNTYHTSINSRSIKKYIIFTLRSGFFFKKSIDAYKERRIVLTYNSFW